MDRLAERSFEVSDSRPYPSRRSIHAEMLRFAKSSTPHGLALFGFDFAIYFAAIAGVLFLDPLWAKILCGVVAGVKISNLSTLAHDAAHGSLVRDPRLNKLLAILAFAPGLFNYHLWVYDHHVLHHPKVNGKHRDSFTPFSKAEFDALPWHRKLRERFYRAPLGVGFAVYYLVERALGVKIMPRKFMPERVRAAGWPHFVGLMVFGVAFVTGLALAPFYSHTGSVTAVLLGFILPYYVWMEMIGFTLYVQHTHPRIAWFDRPVDRVREAPPELLTTHIEFPRWFKWMVHNVYDHAAHHLQARIPCYRLADAQARLNQIIGAQAIVEGFSMIRFADTVRRCKLYDFEQRCWLDFNGMPTTEPLARMNDTATEWEETDPVADESVAIPQVRHLTVVKG